MRFLCLWCKVRLAELTEKLSVITLCIQAYGHFFNDVSEVSLFTLSDRDITPSVAID